MSSSENNSVKLDFKNKIRLNGWWRLWIFASALWFSILLFLNLSSWMNGEYSKEIARHELILKSLSKYHQNLIVRWWENKSDFNTQEATFPNGTTVYFKMPLSTSNINEWSKLYYQNGKKIQSEERLKNQSILLKSIALPPIIIAIIGKSIAWIINGFKSHR